MILESRSIIFSEEELVIALKPVLQAKGLEPDLDPDQIVTCLDSEGDVAVHYKMSGSDDVNFESREVGPAVLNHCIENDIPLPRGAYKELALRGDHVALIVRIESKGTAN